MNDRQEPVVAIAVLYDRQEPVWQQQFCMTDVKNITIFKCILETLNPKQLLLCNIKLKYKFFNKLNALLNCGININI